MSFCRNPLYSYPRQWLFGLLSIGLEPFVKQHPKLVVLTSFHGDGYRGNTKIIFEKLLDHPHIIPVWLSRNTKLVQELQHRYGIEKAARLHSFKGLIILAKARSILMTHGTSDYAFMRLPRRASLIQTYHGLPTKRGEYLRPKSDRPPGWFHRRVLKYRFSTIDYFLSSSPEVTRLFSARFNLPATKFVETGYPYTDEIIHATYDSNRLKSILLASEKPKNIAFPEQSPDKIILYAPTYRKLQPTRWFPFDDFDPRKLNLFLERHNALIILRPHPNERPDFRSHILPDSRIRICTDKILEDAAGLLPLCNVIITDYSGIYLEGLLKDIPAIFLPYDLESYERGFPWNYAEVTPGPKPKTFDEFLISLESAFQGAEDFSIARNRTRSMFFDRPDGNAVLRVIEFLETLMKSDPVKTHSNNF
jgi:CDP-glycerol glycerophosphotransferase